MQQMCCIVKGAFRNTDGTRARQRWRDSSSRKRDSLLAMGERPEENRTSGCAREVDVATRLQLFRPKQMSAVTTGYKQNRWSGIGFPVMCRSGICAGGALGAGGREFESPRPDQPTNQPTTANRPTVRR